MKKQFALNEITYTANLDTNRYSKTENGKTTRIGKVEFEAQEAIYDMNMSAKLEAAVAEVEESETTEEVEEIQQEMKPEEKPRAKKTRKVTKEQRQKNLRNKVLNTGGMEFDHDGAAILLTSTQVDFIRHLPDTYFWERGLDSTLWIDCLCDDIKGQFAGKPMTVGAMVSTLREKGLVIVGIDRPNGKKAKFMGLTDMGKKVAAELGLH